MTGKLSPPIILHKVCGWTVALPYTNRAFLDTFFLKIIIKKNTLSPPESASINTLVSFHVLYIQVDKNMVIMDCEEPVSQLMKVISSLLSFS